MRFFLTIALVFLVSLSDFLKAELCPDYSVEAGIGYDYFRGLAEGSWEGNTGALVSCNVGIFTSYPSAGCLGAQAGGSYGVYDWSGRGSSPKGKQGSTQQQVFLTGAIFRKTCSCSGLNAGLAYDWMGNKNFGVFALQNDIGQLRFQGGYILDQKDEWGIWGTLDVHTSHKRSQGIPISFRAISQVNLYWQHFFDNNAQTVLWAGIPYKKSLMFSTGRAGKFILGASFHTPLTCRLSLEGHACYMRGHSGSRFVRHRDYGANICLELKWAFGDEANGLEPYMPIANNSNFLVDTNIAF
jgi:hypothetical protein